MEQSSVIFVAGANTLIGGALVTTLQQQKYTNLVGVLSDAPDLTDACQVDQFFLHHHPDYVFLSGGKSGGIQANIKYPATLMLDNLKVNNNVIDAAYRYHTKKLFYFASSCSYPRLSPQPIKEEVLLTGPLEQTNEAYAVAKIAGIKLCQAYQKQYGANFVVGIPANGFGIGDDFSPEESHVIPALIHKMHLARLNNEKEIMVWGTGNPRREFLFADDLADASIFAMNRYSGSEPINLAGGENLSIRQIAYMVRDIVGFTGAIQFDITKPDGMPLKALDGEKLRSLGWKPAYSFAEALKITYAWYLKKVSLPQ